MKYLVFKWSYVCCTFDYFFMSETHVASSPIDSEILYIFNTVRFIVSEVNIYVKKKKSVLSCHLKYFEYWYQFTWKKCGESNCFINGGIWPGVFQFYWSVSHFPSSEANNRFCTFLLYFFWWCLILRSQLFYHIDVLVQDGIHIN